MDSTETINATVIYWRDIPTQITIGRGRKAIKHQLPDRFMVAVDKAAMVGNAASEDAYLQDWRKVAVALEADGAKQAIDQLATKIETDYPTKRLAQLASQSGQEQD